MFRREGEKKKRNLFIFYDNPQNLVKKKIVNPKNKRKRISIEYSRHERIYTYIYIYIYHILAYRSRNGSLVDAIARETA